MIMLHSIIPILYQAIAMMMNGLFNGGRATQYRVA
jgi:hypothetical protein